MAQSISRTNSLLLRMACLVLVFSGCGEPDGSIENSGIAENRPAQLRIASLSPAMTTIAIDLGLGERIVGCTPFCRGLEAPVPVVGSLEDVDAEVLIRLKPSVLLLQPGAGGADPALVELGARLGFTIVQQRLDTLGDVQEAIRKIGAVCVADEDSARVQELCSRIAALQSEGDPQGPRTILLYSVEPLGAAGEDTYLDEVLTAAGGRNILGRSGWVELSVEELLARDPDVVVVFARSAPESLGALPWARTPRVLVIDSPDAMEPSSRAGSVAAKIRASLGERP